ncbi:hypothetical protein [uncultured Ruegeria sp.]|uniref:hypothetical protein n=1 Tax=uncultured Ruegeria sp. TaxID=259304 RepID=UPI00262D93D7|nr:hypothetical protein [uncultured Ruegeria sp.]
MKRNLFSKISGKRETPLAPAPTKPSEQSQAQPSLDWSDQLGKSDYLGKAADAKHAAKAAVKAGEHDKAWGLFHEQKEHYLKHAQAQGFDAEQVMRMDGSVSEDFANILRIEKRHTQALVHVLYWIVTSPQTIKRHDTKLEAYFARCKFQTTMLGDRRCTAISAVH